MAGFEDLAVELLTLVCANLSKDDTEAFCLINRSCSAVGITQRFKEIKVYTYMPSLERIAKIANSNLAGLVTRINYDPDIVDPGCLVDGVPLYELWKDETAY